MKPNLLRYIGGFGLVAGALLVPSPSQAQSFCYMIDASGRTINLNALCASGGASQTQPSQGMAPGSAAQPQADTLPQTTNITIFGAPTQTAPGAVSGSAPATTGSTPAVPTNTVPTNTVPTNTVPTNSVGNGNPGTVPTQTTQPVGGQPAGTLTPVPTTGGTRPGIPVRNITTPGIAVPQIQSPTVDGPASSAPGTGSTQVRDGNRVIVVPATSETNTQPQTR